jgi:3-oxoacyl-[acyl-carrier-protein] synthase-1
VRRPTSRTGFRSRSRPTSCRGGRPKSDALSRGWNSVEPSPWIKLSLTAAAPDEVSHERDRHVMGSGGPSTRAIVEAQTLLAPRETGRPVCSAKSMSSTAGDASTGSKLKAQLFNFVCLAHPITALARPTSISLVTAGCDVRWGCEELDWTLSVLFDARGAMSSPITTRLRLRL